MPIIPPKEVHSNLKVLLDVVDTLPKHIQVVLSGVLIQLNKVLNTKARTLVLVQEALTQLRVDVKYLLFDLEATRRERDELQRKLDEK